MDNSRKSVNYIRFNLSGIYDGMDNTVDLTDIKGTNCFCDEEAEKEIGRRIDSFGELPPVRFIDTGNYHYMSFLLMKRIRTSFALLLLDNHPDAKLPDFFDITSCGDWVRKACESLDNLKQVIMAGVDPKLIEEAGPLPDKIRVCTLDQAVDAIEQINSRMDIYISLDKDIFNTDYARTDWSQGDYTPDHILPVICSVRSCLALDICGDHKDYSSKGGSGLSERTNKTILDQIKKRGKPRFVI